MGYLYENGLGVDQDYKTAFNYYSKADSGSSQNNPKALYKLGNFFYQGLGMNFKNKEKAICYYKKAAELGDSDSLNRLGEIYESGIDVQKNNKIAEQFYLEAEERGNDEAKVNLAFLLLNDEKGGLKVD